MCVDLSLLHFSFPTISRVHCLFPLRSSAAIQGGSPSAGNLSYTVGDAPEDVRRRREEILRACRPLGLSRIVDVTQVHGTRILSDPEGENLSDEADGLATTTPHKGLFIKTADCQSLLIAERSERAILALHVGWRGNRAEFIRSALTWFCDTCAVSPRDLFAVRGPSLSPAKAEFVHFASEWPESFRPYFSPETRTMDLWALTRDQLQEAGVPGTQIFGIDLCTMSNPSCFSYRARKDAGRLGGIIWIG